MPSLRDDLVGCSGVLFGVSHFPLLMFVCFVFASADRRGVSTTLSVLALDLGEVLLDSQVQEAHLLAQQRGQKVLLPQHVRSGEERDTSISCSRDRHTRARVCLSREQEIDVSRSSPLRTCCGNNTFCPRCWASRCASCTCESNSTSPRSRARTESVVETPRRSADAKTKQTNINRGK